MSADTKLVFDQLTEDAMQLMEDGEYGKVCYFVGLAFSICQPQFSLERRLALLFKFLQESVSIG